MANEKGPVHLRRRTTTTGKQTLYLDIYIKGKRANEYLGLYLVPERTKADREANRQALELAEAIRAKRLLQIRNNEYGFKDEQLSEMELLPFFDMAMGMKKGRDIRWRNCRGHLVEYIGKRKVRLKDIDSAWVSGFKRYLDQAESLAHLDCGAYQRGALKLGTKGAYFGILKTCLNTAVEKGYLDKNPASLVKGFRTADPRRVHLTLDEVRLMAETDCRYPELKRAFLFSCLTGLRKSDISKLVWGEVEQNGEFTRLVYRQKKTNSQEYLDISPQAVDFLGERGSDDKKVFRINFTSKMGEELRKWALNAGVSKPITFHSGRHTFAVLMLDLGADIYTVQKLLGHKELKTTQIYADLLDKKKQAAVSLIPKL